MTPINTALCNILNYYTDLFISQSREEKLGKNKKENIIYNKKGVSYARKKIKTNPWIELKNRPEIIFKFDLSPEVGFVDKVISFNNAIIYCTYNYIFFLVHVHICTRVYLYYTIQ